MFEETMNIPWTRVKQNILKNVNRWSAISEVKFVITHNRVMLLLP